MVCPKCGGQMNENQACPYCGYSAGYTPVNPAQPQNPYQPTYYNPAESAFAPKENMLLGIVGALIGSLLGVASIVLFFQMDMVASLSGLILAFCTLKGYEMLGKKLGNIGIIICILIMLAAPILAYIIDGAIYFTKEWDMGFMDSFKFCIELIKSGAVTVSDIFERVGMVYLFAALGGVGTIVTAFKANKK